MSIMIFLVIDKGKLCEIYRRMCDVYGKVCFSQNNASSSSSSSAQISLTLTRHRLYHPSLSAGLLDYILYLHRATVDMF